MADNATQIISNDIVNLSPFSPSGRLGRIRYLAYGFGLCFASILLIMAVAMLMGGGMMGLLAIGSGGGGAAMGGMLSLTIGVIYIGMFILSIFLAVKRCHDMDWTGWAALLLLIPFVNLIFIFKSGTKGSNKYGAEPPPNSTLLTICGLALPVLGLVGIVAAIVLPMMMGLGSYMGSSSQPMDDAQAKQLQQQLEQMQKEMEQHNQDEPAVAAPAQPETQPQQ